MSGGEIILRPPPGATYPAEANSIAGNTLLYGATGGFLFARGRAGERFAVRNSGATAVIEGIGDHGCEYMTNGLVVVLGVTGKNFGAGMSGGLAYVLDEDQQFEKLYNPAMVGLERLADAAEIARLKELIQRHRSLTESVRAGAVLDGWEKYQPLFWKVIPHPPVASLSPTAPAAAAGGANGQGPGPRGGTDTVVTESGTGSPVAIKA